MFLQPLLTLSKKQKKMIKLTKRPKPRILVDKETQWTNELMSYINNGTDPPVSVKNRYRHEEIKNEVIIETNGKCAYCESKMLHIDHGDIEHIIPKAIKPELSFSWNNLTLVCSKCNKNKRDKYYQNIPFLNPYIDEIEDHLWASGPMILNIINSASGKITIREIGLNRIELIEKRIEAIDTIQVYIENYENSPSEEIKEFLKREIIQFTDSDKEYSFIIKQFLAHHRINMKLNQIDKV